MTADNRASPGPVANMKSGDSPSTPRNTELPKISQASDNILTELHASATDYGVHFNDAWEAPRERMCRAIGAAWTRIASLEATAGLRPASPSIQGSPPELKKLLIEHERLCMEDLRIGFTSEDASRAIEPVTREVLAHRAVIESLFASLEGEREHFRRCVIDQTETLVRNSNELSELRTELSSLKEDALTPEEARHIPLMGDDSEPWNPFCETCKRADAKLRRISSDTRDGVKEK